MMWTNQMTDRRKKTDPGSGQFGSIRLVKWTNQMTDRRKKTDPGSGQFDKVDSLGVSGW